MRDSPFPLPVWLLLFVLAAGLVAPSPSGQSSAPTAKPAGSTAAAVNQKVDDADSFCSERIERVLGPARAASARVTPLIALVPDPIDSGLYYDYDGVIDTVCSTVEQCGWDRDRSFFPWNDPTARSEAEREQSIACRTTAPGVLLYRKSLAGTSQGPKAGSDESPSSLEYMALFVVGETPTAGVHREALRRALGIAGSFAPRPVPEPKLMVLGPTFSGTASSLKSELLAWHSGFSDALPWVGVNIVSGSATRTDVGDTLQMEEAKHLPSGVRFERTIPTDDDTADAFFNRFLKNWNVDFSYQEQKSDDAEDGHYRIGLVVESGTAYGRSLAGDRSLVIEFPPHISSLRAAYDKEQTNDANKQTRPKQLAPPGLGVSLDEIEAPRAIDTNMSPKSAVAHDVVFGNLVQRWIGSQVQYVGIGATNVADVIFVAHRVRQAAPDVRFFTFTHDALLLHWAFSSDLDGMLVATAFPSLSTEDSGHLVPLNSDIGGGIHAATARLLDCSTPADTISAGGSPSRATPDRSAPPVWVGVIGKGTFWPLWRSESTRPLDAKLTDPKPWKLVFLLVVLASLYHAAAYAASALEALYRSSGRLADTLRRVARPLPREARHWLHKIFGDYLPAARHALLVPRSLRLSALDPPLVVEQRLFLTAMFSGMTTVVLAWAWVAGLARGDDSAVTAWILGSAPGHDSTLDPINRTLAAIGYFAAFALGCVSFQSWLSLIAGLFSKGLTLPRSLWYMGATALLASMTFFVARWAMRGLNVPAGFELLTYERLTQLTNSVNPLIPATLVYLLLHLCYMGNLVRLRSASAFGSAPASASSRPSLPLGRLFEKVGVEGPLIQDAELRLRGALSGSAAARTGFLLLLAAMLTVAAALGAVLLFVLRLSTVEGPVIDWLFAVLLPVCSFALSTSFLWVLFLRARLARLLRLIGTLPLVDAFGRLPASLSGPIPVLLAAGPGRVEDLAPWVREFGSLDAGLAPAVVAAQFREETKHRHGDTAVIASETFALLVKGGAAVVEWLAGKWAEQPGKKPAGQGAPDARVAAAEEFVAALVVFVLREALHCCRTYFAVLSGGSLLLGLTVASYVFEPQAALMSIVLSILLVLVVVGVIVYVSLDRDEILSRLSGSDPGKLGVNFAALRWAITWAVIPLASAVMLRYPNIWGRVSSWIAPLAGW